MNRFRRVRHVNLPLPFFKIRLGRHSILYQYTQIGLTDLLRDIGQGSRMVQVETEGTKGVIKHEKWPRRAKRTV